MGHSADLSKGESRLEVRARDPKQRPQMAEGPTPTGDLTPNEDFFIVHHYAPAEVTPESWSLELTARGGARETLKLGDLQALPQHSVTALIECAGMSRGYLPEPRVGTQFGHGMVGAATWGGPRPRNVLDKAGIAFDFETLIIRAGDSGVTQPENEHSDFSKGLPREKALDDDTLLALTMNGETLPICMAAPCGLSCPAGTASGG